MYVVILLVFLTCLLIEVFYLIFHREGDSMSASSYRHVPVRQIIQDTDKAFLVQPEDEGVSPFWVPKSQVANEEEYGKGDQDLTLSISEWFINKEGLQDICEE